MAVVVGGGGGGGRGGEVESDSGGGVAASAGTLPCASRAQMVAFRALVRDRRARLSARHAATSLGAFGKVASFDDGSRSHRVDRDMEADVGS